MGYPSGDFYVDIWMSHPSIYVFFLIKLKSLSISTDAFSKEDIMGVVNQTPSVKTLLITNGTQ